MPPPRLRAAGFLAFKALWFALLALAVIAPVAGVYVREQMNARIFHPFALAGIGFEIQEGARIRIRARSAEARAAGIEDGERPLAIDGVPVSEAASDASELARRLSGPEGSVLTLTTRLPDGRLATHRLTRSEANIRSAYAGTGIDRRTYRTVQLVLGIFPNYLLIAAAVLLFRRRTRDPVAALLSLSFLMVAANMFHAGFVYRHLDLNFLQGILAVGGWCGFILVLLIFPDGRFVPRWTRWAALLLIPFAVQSYLFLFSWQVDGLLYIAFLAVGVACLALRYRRLSPGTERQQIRWAMFGFVAGIALVAAGIILQIIAALDTNPMAEVWGAIGSEFLLAAGVCCLAGGLLVSLLKYRLYDADAVISRSAGYAALTLMLGATFAATARGIEVFLDTWFSGEAGAWPGVIGAGLAVSLITPLHGRVHGWAERRFQKGLLHLRRDLPPCVGDLRETAGMDELLAEIVERIARGVRAGRVAVLLDGKLAAGRGLEAGAAALPDLPGDASDMIVDHEDALFPLRIPLRSGHGADDAPVGWLLLGPRPDGSLYGKDELDALNEIADPVARAVRIVQLREARERESRAGAARQERRIKALEKAVAALTPRPARAGA